MTNKDEMCNFGVDFKYPAWDKSYPSAKLYSHDAQNETWCGDMVPGTSLLCKHSKTFDILKPLFGNQLF